MYEEKKSAEVLKSAKREQPLLIRGTMDSHGPVHDSGTILSLLVHT